MAIWSVEIARSIVVAERAQTGLRAAAVIKSSCAVRDCDDEQTAIPEIVLLTAGQGCD
jgi:hypothetical protein